MDECLAAELVPYAVDGRINVFIQNQVEHVDFNIWVQSFGQQGVYTLARLHY